MADNTAARLGQINQSGDTDAVYLRTFGGEVITAFDVANVMLPRTFQKKGTGKSVQFPRLGTASAAYHTVGTELTGNSYNAAELLVSPDPQLVSNYFLDNYDEVITHFEERQPIAYAMAQELSTICDKHVIHEGIAGSRLTAVGSELPTGTSVNGNLTFNASNSLLLTTEQSGTGASTTAAKAQAWLDALQKCAQRMDELNVPKMGRFVVVRPREVYPLIVAAQTSGLQLINKDIGGVGSISEGTIGNVLGFDIISSNNLPLTDLSADTGVYTYHKADYSATVGLVGVDRSIAVANWRGLTTSADYIPDKLGTLLIARYIKGIKYLRPEALIELKLATGTVTA